MDVLFLCSDHAVPSCGRSPRAQPHGCPLCVPQRLARLLRSRRRYQVVAMNDFQKQRFVERVISAMFNTVSQKKIAILGFAFKKDTGDTRETPAIDVCKGLIRDNARVCVYDPEVTPEQIFRDLTAPKFEWDRPNYSRSQSHMLENVQVVSDHVAAVDGAHAICVLTEWDEFKTYDYKVRPAAAAALVAVGAQPHTRRPHRESRVGRGRNRGLGPVCLGQRLTCAVRVCPPPQALYDKMTKPAFVFDGRNILDHAHLRELGFIVFALGKPLDPFLVKGY
jgi:UDPglucose 6-dehydrogenase